MNVTNALGVIMTNITKSVDDTDADDTNFRRRVQCYSCGSLFSSVSSDCEIFNPSDASQRATCGLGEACLYYAWKVSDSNTAVIRECFPESILLGSVEKPLEITKDCQPINIEADGSIAACICTTDFCNDADHHLDVDDDDTENDDELQEEVIDEIDITPNITTTELISTSTSTEAPKFSRIICHQCGSLFSNKNSDCKVFDETDNNQQGFCEPGEACLWYSWQKTKNKTSYVRECFSKSVLLGTLDRPLKPTQTCEPQDISEDDQQVVACLCETDYCNSYRSKDEPIPDPKSSINKTNKIALDDPLDVTGLQKPVEINPTRTDKIVKQDRLDVLTTTTQIPASLRCYTCGDLFNPDAQCRARGSDTWNVSDTQNVETCNPGEACLLYMWYKSDNVAASVRHCFPKTILLGSIDDPLRPQTECKMRDITDDGSGSIQACLCDSDLCNDKVIVDTNSDYDKGEIPNKERLQSTTLSTTTTARSITTLPILAEIIKKPSISNDVGVQEVPRSGSGFQVEIDNSLFPETDDKLSDKSLSCFSCGSLFSSVDDGCTQFNASDPTQIQKCKDDEACLMYTWNKSDTQKATVRECFKIDVLLGTISDPLKPQEKCVEKDISEDGSGSGMACLCTTDLCNHSPASQDIASAVFNNPQDISAAVFNDPPIDNEKIENKKLQGKGLEGFNCPDEFYSLDNECFYVSDDKVTWIEARKSCEMKNSKLLTLESESKAIKISNLLKSVVKRHYNEFWTGGNDIDREGDWVWAEEDLGSRRRVPEFGWSELSFTSIEENCLVWVVELLDRRGRGSGQVIDGWHGASCCNMHQFVCQYYPGVLVS